MSRLKIICKIAGKIISYSGLIIGVGWGLKSYPESLPALVLGIICVIVGCLIHEFGEL